MYMHIVFLLGYVCTLYAYVNQYTLSGH